MERGRIASAGVRRLVGSVMPWSGQDGVRVERGWSKDRARAARAQWRVEKVAQTWKRCIFIYIACVLHRFFEFATPCLFHFSTAASLLSFRSCSKENVRGWKDGGVKRDAKKRRGLSEVGVMDRVIMKGRAERWGERRGKSSCKCQSNFYHCSEFLFTFGISSLKIRYPHS